MESLNLSPVKAIEAYSEAGKNKCLRPALKSFLLAILAGALIAFAAAASNTAAHNAETAGIIRLISGMIFPFGLAIVILTGAELFTGNCLIVISVLDKKTTVSRMLKNWLIVYAGNFVGALLVAALCAYAGQFNYSSGKLALFTMKIAESKCTLPFLNAFFLGIACNVLVCLGVLCSMTARDSCGKILGAFLPVALFVLSGFEHSIANMYYVPAGIFASFVYPELAAGAGLSALSWGNFMLKNLLPVTLGNIAGGAGIAALLWYGHSKG